MTKNHSKEMDSHSYKNVHDENPYTRKWIVIHTKIYMTKHTIEFIYLIDIYLIEGKLYSSTLR